MSGSMSVKYCLVFIALIVFSILYYFISAPPLVYFNDSSGRKIVPEYQSLNSSLIRRMSDMVQSAIDCPLVMKPPTYLFKVHDLKVIYDIITVLENSIEVIELDTSLKLDFFKKYHLCQQIKKLNFEENQHSAELWFPFHLKYHLTNILRYNTAINKATLVSPIFYLHEAYPYMATSCSQVKGNSWQSRTDHWNELMKTVLPSQEWSLNQGIDYVFVASHPLSPVIISSPESAYFGQSTFMVTDTDLSGDLARDVIIPYYSDTNSRIERSNIFDSRKFLLFFSGSSRLYFRKDIIQKLKNYVNDGVLITDNLNSSTYTRILKRSKFCLMIRGDTKSARRLFSSINAGCIPVIISDRIVMPYEKLINYSSFSLRFQQSFVLNSPTAFVQYLKSISLLQIKQFQSNMCQVRQLLNYDSQHILNPVSLSFVDLFMRLYKSCLTYSTTANINYFCDKIKRRVNEKKSTSVSINEMLKLY